MCITWSATSALQDRVGTIIAVMNHVHHVVSNIGIAGQEGEAGQACREQLVHQELG